MKKFILLLILLPIFGFSQETYYGYEKLENQSHVDYSKVSKDLSNITRDLVIQKEREAKRLGYSSLGAYNDAQRKARRLRKYNKQQEKLKRKFVNGNKRITTTIIDGKTVFIKK